jgi:hypothetical protein
MFTTPTRSDSRPPMPASKMGNIEVSVWEIVNFDVRSFSLEIARTIDTTTNPAIAK